MDRIWLGLAAWVAGILVALLGWLDSSEAFNAKKFSASVIRSLIAGIIWAAAYNVPNDKPLTWSFIIAAVTSGPFFDVVVNRIGTIAGNSRFPLLGGKDIRAKAPPIIPPAAPSTP